MMATQYFISLFILFLPNINQCETSQPYVCLPGNVCYFGSWINETETNIRYASFQGIRYGKPPIGNLRFKSPEPYVPESDR